MERVVVRQQERYPSPLLWRPPVHFNVSINGGKNKRHQCNLVSRSQRSRLVKRPGDWPGLIAYGPGSKAVTRPGAYFSDFCPDKLELRFTVPPLHFLSDSQFAELLRDAIQKKVRKARAEVRDAGLKFMGAEEVMSQSFLRRAVTWEKKRDTNPRFALKDTGTRCLLITIWQRFTRAYRTALESWQQGMRDIEFPSGTWWMRVHHHAQVTPAVP